MPLFIFLAIIGFLWKGLRHDPHQVPSALIGKPIPRFHCPSLVNSNQPFTQQEFIGHVSLLNVWATWCATCHADHLVLMDIARSKSVVIYGLNYKDNPTAAQQWLTKYGNPYQNVILDAKGSLGIELGVYGTPETFIIDKQGVIRYKYIGAITAAIWQEKLWPEVKKWDLSR